MQPNNIILPDQPCDPDQITGVPNIDNNQDPDNNLTSASYEYMINSTDDENYNSDSECLSSTIDKHQTTLTSSNKKRRHLSPTNNSDDITKDFATQKPDVLVKYITILLKDAVQKERKIKRLQAEFDQRTKEVADLKEIYEKLKKRKSILE